MGFPVLWALYYPVVIYPRLLRQARSASKHALVIIAESIEDAERQVGEAVQKSAVD